MKLLLLFFLFALSACAHMGDTTANAVVSMNKEDQSYYTQCDGAFDSWDSCGKRANTTCANGWHLIDKVERPDTKRKLMFQCNK